MLRRAANTESRAGYNMDCRCLLTHMYRSQLATSVELVVESSTPEACSKVRTACCPTKIIHALQISGSLKADLMFGKTFANLKYTQEQRSACSWLISRYSIVLRLWSACTFDAKFSQFMMAQIVFTIGLWNRRQPKIWTLSIIMYMNGPSKGNECTIILQNSTNASFVSVSNFIFLHSLHKSFVFVPQ